MTSFKYEAIARNGQKSAGIIEAETEMEAALKLRANYDVIERLQPMSAGAVGGKNLMSLQIGGINMKAFTVACSQFAIIMNSGLPIARAVQLIANKTDDKPLREMFSKVSADVEAGSSLADSFEIHGGKKLPGTFIETIRAGEESGNLSNAFSSMADYFDKRMAVKRKIKSAVSYPIFVLVIAVVVVIVLMVAVVPTFASIFEQQGSEIPGVTQALIDLSNFVGNNVVLIVGLIVGIIVVYKVANKTEKGGMAIAKAKLRMPVLGKLMELQAASEFASTMAIMMGSGIPMNRSVDITARVLSNRYVRQLVGGVSNMIEEGFDLSRSLAETEVMPDILVDMVTVGEETGELETTLKTIAGYYDTEYQMAVDGAVGKLSPIILLITAGIAGFIVVAMYVAMFDMYNGM